MTVKSKGILDYQTTSREQGQNAVQLTQGEAEEGTQNTNTQISSSQGKGEADGDGSGKGSKPIVANYVSYLMLSSTRGLQHKGSTLLVQNSLNQKWGSIVAYRGPQG